jgi:hypothetical protein
MGRFFHISRNGQLFHANQEVKNAYSQYIDIYEDQFYMRVLGPGHRCVLGNQIVVNFNGTLSKCCGIFDERNSLGNIFDWKISDLLAFYPPLCDICRSTPLSWR